MPRARAFDPDDALDCALDAFWGSGYEATSMADLLGRMGIQKGSFYATFDGKRSVYVEALRRYTADRFDAMRRELDGLGPRDAIVRMLGCVATECGGPGGGRGCLIVNAAIETAPRDAEVGRVVRESIARHQRWIADLIERGRAAGEIGPQADPDRLARTILGLIFAMRVYTRAGLAEAAADLRDQALLLLE